MSGSFLEKDLTMCCPAASVYILCIFLLTACKTIHFTNGCGVWGFTQISAIILTPSREISNGFAAKTMDLGELPAGSGNRLPNFLNSENLPLFGKSARHLWVNLPVSFGKFAINQGNHLPTLGKWAPDFGKISHWLWENEPPTAGKWATHRLWEKMSHRFWENEPQENQRPPLGKSANDFRKISARLWENQRTTSGKSATD